MKIETDIMGDEDEMKTDIEDEDDDDNLYN